MLMPVTASYSVFSNAAIKKFFDFHTPIGSHAFFSLNQRASFRQDAQVKQNISAWL